MLPIIDTHLSLEQAGGNEALAKDLLGMLLKELPTMHAKVQLAITQLNYTAMWDHAHKLYGSTAYCGVPALREASKRLEEAIKKAELEKINQTYLEVSQQIKLLNDSAPNILGQSWSCSG